MAKINASFALIREKQWFKKVMSTIRQFDLVIKRKQLAAHVRSGVSRLVSDVRGLIFLVSMVTVLMCRRADHHLRATLIV